MVKENNPRITTKKHLAKAEREKKQTRLLIYGSVAIVVLILLILGYGFLDSKYLRANRAVAKVGNISISASDFRSQTILERIQNINQYNYDQTLLQYAQMFGDYSMYVQAYYDSQNIQNKMADATTFAESKLESMIQDAVIQQQAVMFDPPISVSDEEVDKAMEESFGFFPNGTPTADPTSTIWNTPTISNTQLAILGPTRTPTLELTTSPTATDMPTATDQPAIEILATGESAAQATEQKPAATATSLPTETLQPTATLNGTLTPTSTSTPYTYEEYQKNVDTYIEQLAAFELSVDDLRDFIKARMLKQKVYEEVTKDVAEVQDQVWARHILVSTEGEAREILNRLSNGEDWANIAAEVSIDTATKEDGGDLGWFPKEVMVSEFEESAFSQEIGSISEPVQSSMGFHIIQVVGHETRTVSSRYLASIKQKIFDTWITQFITEENVKRDDMWKEFIPTQPELEIQTQS